MVAGEGARGTNPMRRCVQAPSRPLRRFGVESDRENGIPEIAPIFSIGQFP
jgi:hypothetical protein